MELIGGDRWRGAKVVVRRICIDLRRYKKRFEKEKAREGAAKHFHFILRTKS